MGMARLGIFYQQVTCSQVGLINFRCKCQTTRLVLLLVKTTCLENSAARPNWGIICPRFSCDVIVKEELPPDMQCKHTFMVQSRVVSPEPKQEDVTTQFMRESPDLVKEFKLKVSFVDLSKPPLLVGGETIKSMQASTGARIQMETSATREYPSLIHTFFLTHTVGGVFLNPEDKALYDEMLRLHGLGSNTPTGVPYTEDEIMAIVRGGKQRGHILGVGRVLPGQGTVIPPPSQSTSDDKFSQMLNQLESQPEYGGGSGSGGCGDDEPGDDEDGGEDEDDS
ncbi:S-adenosyl-L-methionine-dependent methyltransferases superfamily protein [Tanacetum coccineum]